MKYVVGLIIVLIALTIWECGLKENWDDFSDDLADKIKNKFKNK